VQTIIEYHTHLRRKFANFFISCLISHTILPSLEKQKADYQMDHWFCLSANEEEHLHLLLLVLKQKDEERIENHHISDFKNFCLLTNKNITFTHFKLFIHNSMWSYPLKISLVNGMCNIKILLLLQEIVSLIKFCVIIYFLIIIFEGIKWFLGAEKAIYYLRILLFVSPKMESCMIIFLHTQ
jgi:hypothetical protein